MEKLYGRGTGWEVSAAHILPSYLPLCLTIASQDVSLMAMLQGQAYLPATMFSTTRVMDSLSEVVSPQ